MNRIRVGTSNFLPVYLAQRFGGTIIIGTSGGGKSTLIENIIYQDSFFPHSKFIYDPAGPLAESAYSILKGRAEYSTLDNPVSVNPLRWPYTPAQISNAIVEAVNHQITTSTSNLEMSVNMNLLMTEAVDSCITRERKTLRAVTDWLKNGRSLREARDGLIGRLEMLLCDKMEKVLCGDESADFTAYINQGKSLIQDCHGMNKAEISFLGCLWTQALQCHFRFQKSYKPISYIVDECHLAVNPWFFDILKEGRKYQISAVLATQDFALMRDNMTRVMLGSRNIVSFRCGAREAEFIAKELNLKKDELVVLPNFEFFYKTDGIVGHGKADRPPVYRRIKAEVKSETRPRWFPLEFYQSA